MALTIENLQFRQVFKNLSFAFETGKMTLLIGDTGSGKSTLFHLLTHFKELDFKGKIMLDKIELSQLPVHQRVKYISMMFQNPNRQFTMPTLYEELIFTLENLQMPAEEIEKKIKEAVAYCRVEHLLYRDYLTLSGGEKQQASLAVLLAIDAQIILLDEPFASVDKQARKRLISLLADLSKKGKTILLTDHDQSNYAEVIDHLVELKDGKLQELDKTVLNSAPLSFQLLAQPSPPIPLLRLQNLSCQFGQRRLFHIHDFTFNQGLSTLIGANGAGKSTLFRAILQLQKYEGSISYLGKTLKKSKKLYQQMTAVVQDAEKQFVRTTPREEVSLLPLSPENQQKADEAIDFFCLRDRLDSSLFHLSGGQKKIIQLVSILSLDIPLVLMDEPFTGLDHQACHFFAEWIKEKSQKQSFIIISHRLEPLKDISDYLVELTADGLAERSSL